MSSNAASDRLSEYRGGESVTSTLERHEVFEASGAGVARVTTSSGDVTIGASDSNVIEVTLSVKDASYQRMLDDASSSTTPERTRWSCVRGPTRVSTPCGVFGPRCVATPFEFGGSDPDVHVAFPKDRRSR